MVTVDCSARWSARVLGIVSMLVAIPAIVAAEGAAEGASQPRVDHTSHVPTEVHDAVMQEFVQFDQGFGRAAEPGGEARTVVRDRLNGQVSVYPGFAVEAVGDLISTLDGRVEPYVWDYPHLVASVGPKLRLFSSPTGAAFALGAFYEFRYRNRSESSLSFDDTGTQHFADVVLLGNWGRGPLGIQASAGTNVSMDTGAAANEMFFGLAPEVDLRPALPVALIAEYGLNYLQYGSRSIATSFFDHVDQRVAAGVEYSAGANLRFAVRYVGDFNATLRLHLAQASIGWTFH